MKFIVLGTTETTLNLVHGLIETKHKLISLISLDKRNLPNNSVDNKKFAKENGIEYFETADINSKDSIKYLRRLKADFFISTWPRIISLKVLKIPKFGVIGTHPSPIPINRGRHPLHWMIALKIKRSEISFFLMDEGIDTGNILYHKSFNLGNNMISANQNLNKAAKSGLKNLLKILDKNPNFIGQKQSKLYANTLRKRNEHDITIDPRMSADIILRIVSSFCKPYPMARLYVDKAVAYHKKIYCGKQYQPVQVKLVQFCDWVDDKDHDPVLTKDTVVQSAEVDGKLHFKIHDVVLTNPRDTDEQDLYETIERIESTGG